MDAFGRYANLVAKADTSKRLLEALASTSMVAAKSGTEGELIKGSRGTGTVRHCGAGRNRHDGPLDASGNGKQGRLGVAKAGLHRGMRKTFEGTVP